MKIHESKLRSLLFLAVFPLSFLVLFQPWFRFAEIHAFDFQRWVEVVVFAILPVFCFPVLWRVVREGACFFLFCMVLVAILGVLSSWSNYDRLFLWVGFLRPALMVWVFLGLWGVWGEVSDNNKKFFLWAWIFSVGCYVLYVLVGAFALAFSGVFDKIFLVSGFSNINHAAGFLLIALLVVPGVAEFLSGGEGLSKRIFFSVSVGLVFLLLVIGSRGAFLGWLVVVVVFALFNKKGKTRGYLYWLLESALVGLIIYLLFLLLLFALDVRFLPRESSIASDSGRLELYRKAWNGAVESPWLGHGPLSFAGLPDVFLGHAHNFYLTVLYELGFPATVVLAGLSAYAVWIIWKKREKIAGDPLALAGCAGLLAFAVHSQFSGLSMIPATVLMVMLASAFVASVWLPKKVVSFKRGFVFFGSLLGALLGILYFMLVLNYWWAVDEAVGQKPRFWLQGSTETWVSSP